MKTKTILFIMALLLIGMISSAEAKLQFFQYKSDLGNKTILNHMAFCYDRIDLIYNSDVSDYVKGNNKFEAYLWTNIYLNKWNRNNPNYTISNCTYYVTQSTRITPAQVIRDYFYDNTTLDQLNSKFFVNLADGDCIISQLKCTYDSNASQSELDIPAEQQLVSPTWECKACQQYEWSEVEIDIVKGQTIGENASEVSSFIKRFMILNFEIALALFWLFMIAMTLAVIGLLFVLMFWFYLLVKRFLK